MLAFTPLPRPSERTAIVWPSVSRPLPCLRRVLHRVSGFRSGYPGSCRRESHLHLDGPDELQQARLGLGRGRPSRLAISCPTFIWLSTTCWTLSMVSCLSRLPSVPLLLDERAVHVNAGDKVLTEDGEDDLVDVQIQMRIGLLAFDDRLAGGEDVLVIIQVAKNGCTGLTDDRVRINPEHPTNAGFTTWIFIDASSPTSPLGS